MAVINKAIVAYFRDDDSVDELILDRNELNLRTERSRKRMNRAIQEGFLDFKNKDHLSLIRCYFMREGNLPDTELILFWQYALSNDLFRMITTQVFVKAYFSGRAGLSKEDVIGFLKELINQNKNLDLGWSEKTISTIAAKYQTIMTKLNFLEGVRNKTFCHIQLSEESLILFLYFASLHDPNTRNILKNSFFPLCFISKEDILVRLKDIAMKDYFEMSFDGAILNVDLTTSYQGICDALFNGS